MRRTMIQAGKECRRRSVTQYDVYDYSKSTRDNYLARPDSFDYGKFTPEYAAIRERLDHAYHGMYTLARQAVQDELIAATCESATPEDRPWIVFTAGAMGAGKSHTMTWLSEHGIFPLSEVVTIDADLFKTALPEWDE